jgi:hypothetical protein
MDYDNDMPTKEPRLNREAIEKTIALVESFGDRPKVVMGDWLSLIDQEKPYHGDTGNFCNTVCCAAGWAVMANRFDDIKEAMEESYIVEARQGIQDSATETLGLTEEQGSHLFFMYGLYDWYLYKLAGGQWACRSLNLSSFDDELPASVRNKALLHVLYILLDTGEINWPKAISFALKEYKPEQGEKIFVGL